MESTALAIGFFDSGSRFSIGAIGADDIGQPW